MSQEAMTAVNIHSGLKTLELFRLLGRLADCADRCGIIDPAPNQETMAEWFGVSARTIRTRISSIIESGELEQIRVGSGPGKPSAYRIMLPLQEKADDKSGEAALWDALRKLQAEVDALKVEAKVEAEATNGHDEGYFPPKGGSNGGDTSPSNAQTIPFDPIGVLKDNPLTPLLPPLMGDAPQIWGQTPPATVVMDFLTLMEQRGRVMAPPPTKSNEFQEGWNAAAQELLGICDGSVDQARTLMRETMDYMDGANLTYTRPRSLVTCALRTVKSRSEVDIKTIFDTVLEESSRKGRMRFREWEIPDVARRVILAMQDGIGKMVGNSPQRYFNEFQETYRGLSAPA